VKILVVEDDPIVAESLNHLLASYAYAVDIANDGEVGLELVESYGYDLIVLDVVLPGLDGLSLGHLASGIAHDLNNVFTPIVALTQVLRLSQRHLTTKGREQLRLLEESAKRGVNLVQQALTMTWGRAGERTTVNLIEVLEEVVSMSQQSLPKSIEIQPHFLDQHSADLPSMRIPLLMRYF